MNLKQKAKAWRKKITNNDPVIEGVIEGVFRIAVVVFCFWLVWKML